MARRSSLFEIAYRTGGTELCQWHRVLGQFTAEERDAKQAELSRMGYKSLSYNAGVLDVIGLPEGWEYNRQ